MEFEIDRTSLFGPDYKNTPPITGATKVERNGFSYWVKDFDSLDDILQLIRTEQEDIVILYNRDNENYPEFCIEIYDDYRE